MGDYKEIGVKAVSLIEEYALGLLPDAGAGKESDIVDMFLMCIASGRNPADELPIIPGVDTVLTEMSFRYGRADIVIFHIDGSASVIEVKDGSNGYKHVVSGIGQAGLYAQQVFAKGAISNVRKCLLWTSTGKIELDAVIYDACLASGTIPLAWGALKMHKALTAEAIRRAKIAIEKAKQ